MSLTNFQLSGNLSFAPGSGVNTTIEPGFAAEVEVDYLPAQDHSGETLTFVSSSSSGMASQTIYFNSIVPQFSINEDFFQTEVTITPSKIAWQQTVEFDWHIIDLSGRVIAKGNSQDENEIQLSSFQNGVYIFSAMAGTGRFSQKFIVTNR